MISQYLRSLYNRVIRPYTPRKIAVFNGIAVRGVHLFDFTDIFPNYEKALISAIRSQVDTGDNVVIIGGGRGVSSVAAAHQTGSTGSVVAYEGAINRVSLAEETIEMNKVSNIVELNHAIVGESIKLADEAGDATKISQEKLPSCDVLVLDCEGAEKGILKSLNLAPEVIIVETHGHLNSPEEVIREILSERGYAVINRDIEIQEDGIFVLTAMNNAH